MERLWTKPFTSMTAGMFFLFTAFYMLYPTLPLFIKQMGGNESQVGLAAGTFMLAAVIFRPVVGGLLDRFGRRSFVTWGLLLFALAMYMYTWIGGIVPLLVLRGLHGISWAIATTSILTAITDMIPAKRRGEGLGWSGMAMTLAMAAGPVLGLWVTRKLSFHALFLFAVSLSIMALLLAFLAKIPDQPQPNVNKAGFFEKSVLPFTIPVFFLFIAYGGVTTFVPLFTDSIKVNSGVFFTVYALTLVLMRPIGGKLSDLHGEKVVIIPSLSITIVALVTLSFSTGLFGIILSAVLYGIGFGSAQPPLQAAIIRLVPPSRAGVANASFSTATDLGIGLGAIALGWTSQHTSYQVLFLVCAASVVLSLFMFSMLTKRAKTYSIHSLENFEHNNT